MTLNQMQYFSTACETKNMSLAAEMLYISQPTLSASLSALEKEVGFQLFYRKSKGICPTEAVSYTHLDVYKRQTLRWLMN